MTEKEHSIVGIILAAGQSKRFGTENKLLAEFNGASLISTTVSAAQESQLARIILVLGHQADEIQKALGSFDVELVRNDRFGDGLATSLKAGLGAIDSDVSHVMILLADMPDVRTEHIDKTIRASKMEPDAIVVAASDGALGNPVIWPSTYFTEMRELKGDRGARSLLSKYKSNVIRIEIGEVAALDIDTPSAAEDYLKR